MRWTKRNDFVSIEQVILNNLGVSDEADLKKWSDRSHNNDYRLDGTQEFARIINENKDKHIHICGDYDVDGRTASIIMYLGLKHFGCKNLSVRIPRRFSEGYGLNQNMIDEVAEDDALIITVDNGIAAMDVIRYAKNRGMTVVVTDHHLPQTGNDGIILPDADLIVDPNAIPNSADFNGYCGAGVAYKLIRSLINDDEYTKGLLPFVAIATIADVMELREENRVFVYDGLDMLNRRETTEGVLALMDGMGIETCTSTDIGFKIAPALNATGRMNDIDKFTLQLLVCNKYEKSLELAQNVISENRHRKYVVDKGFEKSVQLLENWNGGMIILSVEVHAGVLGILAGRLCDRYNVPVIVFGTPDNDGLMHGSARSLEEVDIQALLTSCSEHFVKFGGHAQAAGVTVAANHFEEMKEAVLNAFDELGFEYTPPEEGFYDLEIEPQEILPVLDVLDRYEPFGQGNPKPIFKIHNFRLIQPPKQISGNGVRLKGTTGTAVGFGLWPLVQGAETELSLYDLYGTVSWNEYMGRKTPQIELIDMQRKDTKKVTAFAKKLQSM